ncbi:MAG: hypothetical protein S4CHLAM20_01000 [Chlamydiia bacterium]|nr:hypothetical protein [Chlamydiia bacterium]
MEYTNEQDFFKEVKAKNLLLADDKDQAHLISRIKNSNVGECFFFDEERTFADLMNEIMQPSLFGGKKIMIVLDCSSYSGEQWDEIFKQEGSICFFFKKTSSKSLEERFKRCGSILRLTAEKPWDRKNRLVKEVVYTIHKDGVTISQPTAYRFVERVHNNLQLFHTELNKLRAYAKGKSKIEDTDIDAIVKPLPEENLFKVSEEVVWKGVFFPNFTLDGISNLLQIIGSFRFQAYLGLKILSHEEVKLPPWQEKKYKQKAKSMGDSFFKEILMIAFRAERRAKQSSITATAIFNLLSLELIRAFTRSSINQSAFLKR